MSSERWVDIDARVRRMHCSTCGVKPGKPCVVIRRNAPRLGEPTGRMHIARYYAMWRKSGAYD